MEAFREKYGSGDQRRDEEGCSPLPEARRSPSLASREGSHSRRDFLFDELLSSILEQRLISAHL